MPETVKIDPKDQLEKVKSLAQNTLVLLEQVNVTGSAAINLANSIAWISSMQNSCETQLKQLWVETQDAEKKAIRKRRANTNVEA